MHCVVFVVDVVAADSQQPLSSYVFKLQLFVNDFTKKKYTSRFVVTKIVSKGCK